MPPISDHNTNMGWRLFFGLLMFLQVVALGVMWRTYDSIAETRSIADMTQIKVDSILLPAVRDHEERLRQLGR